MSLRLMKPGCHTHWYLDQCFVKDFALPSWLIVLQKSTLSADKFSKLRQWITRFLDQNKDMTASQIGHNMLIEKAGRRLYSFRLRHF